MNLDFIKVKHTVTWEARQADELIVMQTTAPAPLSVPERPPMHTHRTHTAHARPDAPFGPVGKASIQIWNFLEQPFNFLFFFPFLPISVPAPHVLRDVPDFLRFGLSVLLWLSPFQRSVGFFCPFTESASSRTV